jgi:membrane fusion protein (multidrug efflux system)
MRSAFALRDLYALLTFQPFTLQPIIQPATSMTEQPSPAQASAPSKTKIKPHHRRWGLVMIGFLCLIFTANFAIFRFFHESTDNAYVTAHVHYIAPRITGVVDKVEVENNTRVKAGDVLVRIDPEPFDVQLADAVVKNERAQGDYERAQGLASTRVVSVQDLAHARDDANSAAAQLRMAQLNRKYTEILSPVDGVVGGRSVEAGNTVMPSINLLAIVEGKPWVEANFKETQVAHIHPGQRVTMTIDAIPGKTFQGKVVSIAPASGRQFALLPADNATGNFTKIVQRLPVRIEFDPASIKGYEYRLAPGLSIVASVRVR